MDLIYIYIHVYIYILYITLWGGINGYMHVSCPMFLFSNVCILRFFMPRMLPSSLRGALGIARCTGITMMAPAWDQLLLRFGAKRINE